MEILSKKKTTLAKRNLSPKTCRDWSLFSALQISAQKQQTFQIVFIKHGNSLKEKNNSSKTQFESQDMSRLELVFCSPIFGAEATNVSNCFYKTWKFSQKNNFSKTQFESQDMSRLELVFRSPIFGADATNVSNCLYKKWKFSQRKKQLFQNAMLVPRHVEIGACFQDSKFRRR